MFYAIKWRMYSGLRSFQNIFSLRAPDRVELRRSYRTVCQTNFDLFSEYAFCEKPKPTMGIFIAEYVEIP